MKSAIRKYGIENFKKEILQECNSLEELKKTETYWIQTLSAYDRNIGYNISNFSWGGDTFTNNPNKEIIRQKHIKIQTGRKYSIEARKKMSESWTEERKKNHNRKGISSWNKGMKTFQKKLKCIYCKKYFWPMNFGRWHNKKCKLNDINV